ncbi:MAG TPA: cytochrome b N-terminal domain-containing protein [Candidatus Limnocylindrales bacterium]|nr:cytochrome b N-terminal domain-containing protein [Candidatus Limnocylindrales bacterium]
MHRIGRWVDERLNVSPLIAGFLDRKVPGNIGWFHTLGSATLFLLIVQIATGIALSMSYVPSPDHAYQSILYIDQTPFGGAVRGIHHWAAGLLVLFIGLHILRVFIWGAHRYPREITWLVGAGLFFIVLGFAFTGYLLPWDQKAYWATVVGTNIAGSAPLIGGAVMEFLRGGEQLGAVTLARFYGIHIWVLPALLLVLVGAHLFGVIRQGIAASPRRHAIVASDPDLSRREAYEREYAAEKRAGKPFWDSLLKDAVVAAILLVVVVALALTQGAPLEPRADPNATNYVPRPEWYFLDMFQMLWYFTGDLEPLLIFLVFTFGAVIFLLIPFIDRGTARHPRQRPIAMGLTAVVVVAIVGLTYLGASATPAGVVKIPPTDGMAQAELNGLATFNEQGCASCHQIRGLGGHTGPDLSRAGFRWEPAAIRDQIVTPKDTKMPSYDGLTQEQLDDLVTYLTSLK